MGNTSHISPPFGEYALPPKREAMRTSARALLDTRLGRWRISYRRKRAIHGLNEPYDIEIAADVKVRLYPSTNRCEKRALCGVQIWDPVERRALQDAIAVPSNTPFVFLDIGANVGLYSLFAQSYAREAGRDIRLIAVEPSAEMGMRLKANAAVSEAKIDLIQTAISTSAGNVFLSDGGGNRGEGRIAQSGEAVSALTLLQLCQQQNISRIDALKSDIEGMDLAVLKQFFEQAPATLHPHMMILELLSDSAAPLIELTARHAYLIQERTRMNVVVAKRDRT